MAEIFECKVLFDDDDIKLQDYEKLLKKFTQWTQFKREIRLTSLLECKRIQYDVEEITFPIYGTTGYDLDITFSKVAFIVIAMSFIISGDSIDELKVKIRILDTESGKKILNDIKDIKIKQKKIGDSLRFYV